MLRFLLRRLLWMVPTTIGILAIVFLLFHAVPGDPAVVALGTAGESVEASPGYAERLELYRREHGLDRSFLVQFLCVLGPFNLLRDGHPWFRSPCPERALEVWRSAEGASVLEGVPRELEPLTETQGPGRRRMRELVEDWTRGDSLAQGRAAEELYRCGAAAWPYLLNATWREAAGGGAQFGRLEALLVRLAGEQLAVPAERERELGAEARVRAWYGWYYRGIGQSVQNSGARPWSGLLALEWGREQSSGLAIGPELWRRLRLTLPLALAALILTFGLAVPLGVFCARLHSKALRALISGLLYVGYSIPSFWGGLLLIGLFGATGPNWRYWPRLPVLAMSEALPADLGLWGSARELILRSILPVVCLSYASLAYLARHVRASMLEVWQEDFIRALRARGLREGSIVRRHALRNALLPSVTVFGSMLPALVGGSVIVETVFDLPGMGKYAYEGLLHRDLPVVIATTVLMGIITQLGLLLADLLYAWMDPRLRHA